MHRRTMSPIPVLALCLVALAWTSAPAGAQTTPMRPNAWSLLQGADESMQQVSSAHVEGRHISDDTSAHLNVHISGDCSSRWQGGLPLRARTSVAGTFAQSAGPTQEINVRYLVIGTAGDPAVGQIWRRASPGPSHWMPVQRPFATSLDMWYARQACPQLLRLTYLHGYLQERPALRLETVGAAMVGSHSVWHVRATLGYTLDYYIDTASHRLRRLTLSGDIRTTWREDFYYSAFNERLHFAAPAARSS